MSDEELEYDTEIEEVEELDLDAILAEYRKKRMFDMLVGPVVSLVLHVIVFSLLFVFVTGETKTPMPKTEITMVKDKIEELEEEEPEEIIEEEEVVEEVVEVQTEVVEVETSIEDVNDDQPETADEMDTSEVLEVEISNSPLKWTFQGGGRSAAGRKRALGKYGGRTGGKSEKAVLRALRWLKYHQSPNGSWPEKNAGYSQGVTGLALLCFLAHGETPAGSKEFGETVRNSIDWLLKNTTPKKITVHGYNYAIAVYALSEAYGMTQAPKISAAVSKLVRPIIDGQDKQNGWAYNFKKGGPGQTDVSLSGWCIQSLKAAYAAGIEAKGLTEALEKSLKMCDAAITYETGLGKYRLSEGKGHKWSMGAAASLCMQLLGENEHAKVVSVYNRIMKDFRKDETGMFSWKGKKAVKGVHPHTYIGYSWYYQTQVVFQKMKPQAWSRWNSKFLYKEITLNQEIEEAAEDRNGVTKGTKMGFWAWPDPKHGNTNSKWERYYSTALCCLQLEVFYRLLPGTGKRPGEGHANSGGDEGNSNNDFDEGEDSDELNF